MASRRTKQSSTAARAHTSRSGPLTTKIEYARGMRRCIALYSRYALSSEPHRLLGTSLHTHTHTHARDTPPPSASSGATARAQVPRHAPAVAHYRCGGVVDDAGAPVRQQPCGDLRLLHINDGGAARVRRRAAPKQRSLERHAVASLGGHLGGSGQVGLEGCGALAGCRDSAQTGCGLRSARR